MTVAFLPSRALELPHVALDVRKTEIGDPGTQGGRCRARGLDWQTGHDKEKSG